MVQHLAFVVLNPGKKAEKKCVYVSIMNEKKSC